MTTIHDRLTALGACPPALKFYASCRQSPQRAWDECEHGDWLLWLLGKAYGALPPESPERRALTLVAVECAALALSHAKDPRIEAALVMARRWGASDPDVSLADVREARAYAYAAYAADAAAYAAYAAAYAAAADAAAVAAVDAAAVAAVDAYVDAYADAAVAARSRTLARCAAIVRERFPSPPEVLL